MSRMIMGLATLVWLVLKGIVFVVKIVITYFFKCGRDIAKEIRLEWKHRELDDEIY